MMKSAISISASFLLLAASVARAGEPGSYEYYSYESGVTITGYEPDDSSEVVVPAEIEGVPVTTIAWEAFKDCREVTSIVLPENVTSIESRAFINCTSLVSVALPSTLGYVGEGVFFNCRSLVEVTIPDSVTSIGNGAFLGTGLTSISIPPGVTEIGAFAFARCASLEAIHVDPGNESFSSVDGVLFSADKSILYRCPEGRTGDYTIPQKVTSLSDDSCAWCYTREGAFENCGLLDSITLPDALISIGARTFRGCAALGSLTIPEQVSEIDPSAFDDCPALTSIHVASQNANFSVIRGVLLNGDGTELLRCPESRSGHFNVPAGVTVLGQGSFTNCAALISINIPEGVSTIQNSAFSGCVGLEQVHLPASLTEFSLYALSNCPRLSEIEVADGSPLYQSIDGALYGPGGAELLLCPPGRTGNFDIPKGVTAIASGAFANCQQLSGVVIPASVETLNHPYWIFSDCVSLESIEVAEESASFASFGGALYDREMTSVLFCPRAKEGSFTVPHGVESVAWAAFQRCVDLKEVVLPVSLTSIGSDAFLGCTGLRKIRLPDGVTEIGYGAFRACTSLIEFNIPRDLEWLNESVLIGNVSLEAIHVSPGNKSYSSIDGVLFNHDRSTLIRFPRAKAGAYTVPDSVTEIRGRYHWPPECGFDMGWGWGWGSSAYADAIRVGDDWVLAGDPWSDTGSGEEDYDDYEDYYGEGAFEGCHWVMGITLPEGVASIGHFAFYRATGLSSVVLPRSVSSLQSWALAGNESLREVRFLGDVPAYLGWSVFADTSGDLAIDYRLKVVSFRRGWQEDTWSLEWTSVEGDLYAVEISEDLQHWTTLETDISGWGGRTCYTVATDPDLGACSFRVRRVGRE